MLVFAEVLCEEVMHGAVHTKSHEIIQVSMHIAGQQSVVDAAEATAMNAQCQPEDGMTTAEWSRSPGPICAHVAFASICGFAVCFLTNLAA